MISRLIGFFFFTLLSVTSGSSLASGKIYVVTTTTDLAWAVKTIGGDLVTVHSLLNGNEDPHYVDAVPEFIRQAAKADIVCQIGLDLEIGWLPKVLEKSGNRKVQRGGLGFCDVGSKAKPLDVAKGKVDRSMGDVHPKGNPHYWLGPQTFWSASQEILDALINAAPKNRDTFLKNYDIGKKAIQDLTTSIKDLFQIAWGAQPPTLIQYHQEFTYFFHEFGLTSIGSIEEFPGLMPSAGRIGRIGLMSKNSGVRLALAKPTDSKATTEKFSEISGIPVLMFNPSMISKDQIDYPTHLTSLAEKIVAAGSNKVPPEQGK
jgi:zinc/manganese transport system substrate-binding protein